ncbi:MAG: hypothetical protein ACOC1K_04720 [Nanoarchaeota archaeon]
MNENVDVNEFVNDTENFKIVNDSKGNILYKIPLTYDIRGFEVPTQDGINNIIKDLYFNDNEFVKNAYSKQEIINIMMERCDLSEYVFRTIIDVLKQMGYELPINGYKEPSISEKVINFVNDFEKRKKINNE